MGVPRKVDVTVVKCTDIPKGQLLGKQAVYVILRHGDQEFRSKTDKDGGKDPEFNETFTFVIKDEKESTVVECSIMNDRFDKPIGTVRIDVILALQQGKMRKSLPVNSASGQPQGSMDIFVKCEEVLEAVEAAEAVQRVQISEAQEKYNQALVAARSTFYGQLTEQMAPHEAVTGALLDEHLQNVRAVQKEEEKEMGSIFEKPLKEGRELVQEAGREWAGLTEELLKDVGEEMEQQCPEAKAKFPNQLSTMQELMKEAGRRREGEVRGAEQLLMGGLETLLASYRATMAGACERYEETLKGAVLRYKGEVEAVLRREAEEKSVQQASSVAPPPPPSAVSISVPPPAASASSPHPPARSPVGARSPAAPRSPVAPRSPTRGFYYPPAPAPAAPAPAAPAPAGFPMTQAEQARAEQQQAEVEARQARQAAERAQMEANMARQQATASQEMLRQQIEAQRRAQAVRRGVVGGVLLSRAVRR